MPKNKGTRNSVDNVARRLSFEEVEGNGVKVNSQNTSNAIWPTGLRYGDLEITSWPTRQTVLSTHNESDSDLGSTVFPKIVVFILAAIATFFLFGKSVQTLSRLSLVVLGAVCTVLSWMVTFSDSLVPGSYPPSPMSPHKLRKRSGHTFHSSYVICIANGIIAFAVSFWYFSC